MPQHGVVAFKSRDTPQLQILKHISWSLMQGKGLCHTQTHGTQPASPVAPLSGSQAHPCWVPEGIPLPQQRPGAVGCFIRYHSFILNNFSHWWHLPTSRGDPYSLHLSRDFFCEFFFFFGGGGGGGGLFPLKLSH